jgi:hypothetical protein
MTYTPETEAPKLDNLNLIKPEVGTKMKGSRLNDPKRAQELGQKLISQNGERSRKNALLKGQIDGNLPMNPLKLKAAGQSWRTNVNFGEAKASVSAALTPYYDLFTGSKWYFTAETKFGQNVKERNDYSQAITEEADYYVREWDGFEFNMHSMLFEMVTYGKGFVHWPIDQKDWRFQYLAQHLLLVPDNTKAHGSKVTVAVIRQDYLIHELWHLINKPNAENAGWNIQFAKRCIEHAYAPNRGSGGAGSSNGHYDYEAVQQRIKDNDICEGLEAEKIPVFHILVTELNGKVSHFIVPETPIPNGDVKNVTTEKNAVDFLYKGVEDYDNFLHVITPFFFETLDGSWNGANGLAKELYAAIEIKNRLTCATVDSAFLRGSIVMQAVDSTSLEKASLMQIGPFSIIPSGFTIQNNTVSGDIEGPVMVDSLLDNKLQTNTGIWRGRRDKPQGNPRTAEEVRIDFNQSATLSNSAVNRFYLTLDRLYTELMRRLAKDPEFIKRCKERGIPKQALEEIKCVKAHRAVGNGSAFMRQQALKELGPLVPMMPESGRLEWARDTASSTTNSYTAQRYFPNPGDDVGKTDHAAWAALENAALTIGAPVTWTQSQNNVIHAQTHIEFAAAAAQSLQEGGDPMKVLSTLDTVGPHALLHVEKLEGDEIHKTEFKALGEELKRLMSIADELRGEIKRQAQQSAQAQQQAMEKQQQAMTDAEIKLMKAQSDMKIKETKAAQQLEHKQVAHAQKTLLTDAKTAASIAQSQAKMEAQLAQAEAAAAGKETEE